MRKITMLAACAAAAMLAQPATAGQDAERQQRSQAESGPAFSLNADQIKAIQEQMALLGTYSGPADGVWTPDLAQAIDAFGEKRGYDLALAARVEPAAQTAQAPK